MKPILRAVVLSMLVSGLVYLSGPLGSMASLRIVSDYPLMEMDTYGEPFLVPDDAAGVRRVVEWFYPESIDRPRDIFCSLVAARSGQEMIYGRNFDWYRTVPILFRVHAMAGRYGSVSLVDGSYLGVTTLCGWIDGFNAAGGYIAPFDGMNDQGLFVGIAMVSPVDIPEDPDQETLTGVQMVRRLLDTCATVPEALALVHRYNVDFFPGPHLHFLVADKSGESLVVEFTETGVQTVQSTGYACATNFVMNEAEKDEWVGRCHRFDTLREAAAEDGAVSASRMMDLLSEVKQTLVKGRTEWSAVYCTDGTVTVCLGMDYAHEYRFHLKP